MRRMTKREPASVRVGVGGGSGRKGLPAARRHDHGWEESVSPVVFRLYRLLRPSEKEAKNGLQCHQGGAARNVDRISGLTTRFPTRPSGTPSTGGRGIEQQGRLPGRFQSSRRLKVIIQREASNDAQTGPKW
jgi:hypothetical protein